VSSMNVHMLGLWLWPHLLPLITLSTEMGHRELMIINTFASNSNFLNLIFSTSVTQFFSKQYLKVSIPSSIVHSLWVAISSPIYLTGVGQPLTNQFCLKVKTFHSKVNSMYEEVNSVPGSE
jgi:hypothetical protein